MHLSRLLRLELCTLLSCCLLTHASPLVPPTSAAAAPSPLGCRAAGQGRPVDWWVAVKHPRGLRYSYLDSEVPAQQGSCRCQPHGQCPCWCQLDNLNDPQQSPTHRTLSAARPNSTAARFMYNDEDPGGGERWAYAHAKGVLVFDDRSGFWLLHSVPKYPNNPAANHSADLDVPQTYFGQSLFCLSFNTSADLAAIVHAITNIGPYMFEYHLPADLATAFPEARGLVPPRVWWGGSVLQTALHAIRRFAGRMLPPPPQPPISVHAIETLGRAPLLIFSKPKSAHQQVHDFMASYFQGAMLFETWRLGRGALPSNCGGGGGNATFSSINIDRVTFGSNESALDSWSWSFDHAKWGIVTSDGGGPKTVQSHRQGPCLGSGCERSPLNQRAVCFGDLNREAAQVYRGGNYLCVLGDERLWSAFRAAVAVLENCTEEAGSLGLQI